MVRCQREPENGPPGSMYACPRVPPMSLHTLLAASHLHLQGAGTTGLSGWESTLSGIACVGEGSCRPRCLCQQAAWYDVVSSLHPCSVLVLCGKSRLPQAGLRGDEQHPDCGPPPTAFQEYCCLGLGDF